MRGLGGKRTPGAKLTKNNFYYGNKNRGNIEHVIS
jgi:hypothetical protein